MSAAVQQNQQPPQFQQQVDQNSQNIQQHHPQPSAAFSQDATAQQIQNQAQQQPGQPVNVSGPVASLMQLRAEIPPAPPIRNSRKRKSPSGTDNQQQQQQQQQQQGQPLGPPQPQQPQQQQPGQQQGPPQQMHPGLPPPAGNVYPPQAMQYAYGQPPPGSDYSTAGLMTAGAPGAPPQMQGQETSPGPNRQLSTSKRAEQNRKAQRAFRERRDQHVKALESRSQLLDAALASADEANRRWEECRALVDQLRIENTALRSALTQAQAQLNAAGINPAQTVGSGAKPAEQPKADGTQGQPPRTDGAGQPEAPKESTAAS